MYTEHDTGRLRVRLRGSTAVAPALILPGFDRHGTRNGYDVARMIPPHVRPDGSEAKYLGPTGRGSRAYFPPLPCVRSALSTPGDALMITEGILKALAAAQAGVPCIGLMGVWNWVVSGIKPRRPIPDLADIDWRGRMALIVFDFDQVRKPFVNRAAAELAFVLREAGADARILHLPPGNRAPNGKPMKLGIDDYIARLARKAGSQSGGEAEFRRWVQDRLEEPAVRSLEWWRAEMIRARLGALHQSGVHLDRSPTGAGKSHADGAMMQRLDLEARRSLTLVPTHANCREVSTEVGRRGVHAVAFPQLNSKTCLQHEEAVAVIGRGLAFSAVLCPTCPYRDECIYRQELHAAIAAPHAIATHARGTISMERLAGGRDTIMLHENPMDMLRPTFVTTRGLAVVELVARQAEYEAHDAGDRGFYRRLGRIARQLDGWHHGANETVEVPLPDPVEKVPGSLHCDLNEAAVAVGAEPPSEAMQIALAAATGALSLIAVAVNERPGEGGEMKMSRSLVGVSRTYLPPEATILLSDATAARAGIEAVLERPVRDVTPAGRIAMRHPVRQIIPARDVTIGREPATVANVLRGLLYDLRGHRRVGLLTHQKFARSLPGLLGEPYRGRLAMVDYFGSGKSRGSNEWFRRCDVLVVLGTPRVGPDEVRRHLIRLGKRQAARRDREAAGWGMDWWSGVTESGRRVTVRTPHYRDHDWHAGYCAIVRSELIQAVGRGRGILADGIPVYVVSTENLAPPDEEDGRNGFPICDHPFAPLTEAQANVLGVLHPQWRFRVRRKPGAIARQIGVSRQRVFDLLVELEAARRARRIGKARGWVAEIVNPAL